MRYMFVCQLAWRARRHLVEETVRPFSFTRTGRGGQRKIFAAQIPTAPVHERGLQYYHPPAPIRFPGARRCVRPPTGAKSLPTGIGFEGPRVVRQNGTSRAYLIERLRREGRADLVAAIESGQVSAYAVAIELGWVTRHPTLGTGSTNQAKRREHELNNVMREPSAPETPPDRLNHAQDMSLTYGDLPGREAFASYQARREAWLRHRDELLRYCVAGQRPQAWWDYDSPVPYPGRDYAGAALYEAGLLSESELATLMAKWREEFEKAQVPGFMYCLGFVKPRDTSAHGSRAPPPGRRACDGRGFPARCSRNGRPSAGAEPRRRADQLPHRPQSSPSRPPKRKSPRVNGGQRIFEASKRRRSIARPSQTMQPELPSMPPLRLTDDELNAILTAAMPLAVEQRDAFLQQVAAGLASSPEIGPGSCIASFATFKGCTSTRPTSGRAGHPAGANCPSPAREPGADGGADRLVAGGGLDRGQPIDPQPAS